MVDGGTTVQLLHDEIADGFRIVADNGKVFTEVDVLDDTVNHQGFCEEAAEGTESGLCVEYKAGGDDDAHIHEEQSGTDIQFRIFFQNHGNNVSSAAGGSHVKENGCTEGGKNNGKNQFQHGLICQRMAHGKQDFCRGESDRGQHTYINGFPSGVFAQKEKAEEQQQHVDDKGNVTRRSRHGGTQDNGNTGDAPKGKVIGKLKEIDSDYENQSCCGQHEILPDNIVYLHFIGLHDELFLLPESVGIHCLISGGTQQIYLVRYTTKSIAQ